MHTKSLDKEVKTIRADKLLSSLGLTSRRGVERFLKNNNVLSNGVKITQHGQRIDIHSKITINGKKLNKPKLVYFMLNKPKNVITTANDEYGRQNVLSFIKSSERVFPIGRLDRYTHGLLLLTNDGGLTNNLIHPKFHIGKTYQLIIKGAVDPQRLEKLKNGVLLDDGVTSPAKVRTIQKSKTKTIIELTIYEGRKRQIRRMCEALKISLLDLQRIKFGPLELGDLKIGEHRTLTGKEVEMLKGLDLKRKSKVI